MTVDYAIDPDPDSALHGGTHRRPSVLGKFCLETARGIIGSRMLVKRRRSIVLLPDLCLLVLAAWAAKGWAAENVLPLRDLDDAAIRNLVSRADIHYTRPALNAEEGLPIGNGQMGTLVWTTPEEPATIRYQLNRNDTFGMDRTHRHYDPQPRSGQKVETTDNALSLCKVGMRLGKASFREQSLTPYDGTVSFRYETTAGEVRLKTFLAADRDVLVLNVDEPERLEEAVVELAMVRKPLERNGENVRQYSIRENGGVVTILQTVREGTYFMHYAVAVGIAGGRFHGSSPKEDAITLKIKPGTGAFTLLAAGAAAMDERVDVAGKATSLLETARAERFEALLERHQAWWADFWRKGRTFIHLTSKDGSADYLEARYHLHLYHMASSARGTYPPLYNHGLWFSEASGDRDWGAQYKSWNDSMMYFPLFAANRLELTDCYLKMFRRLLPQCEIAARQRFGVSKGAYFPETMSPSGPVILSERAAPMIRDVLMGHRTRASLPPDVVQECLADANLDWINPEFTSVRKDRFSWVSHILSSGGGIAMQFWWRYELTGDERWLRDMAYPVMKSVVEFYAAYAKKDANGRYHIDPANVHESYWGARDGIIDIAAILSLTPKTIRASEILGVDEALRPGWKNLLENLAPYPRTDEPDVARLQSPAGKNVGHGQGIAPFPPGTFGAGRAVECEGRENVDPVWMMPLFPYEHISLARGRYVGNAGDRANFDTMLRTYPHVPPTWYGVMWPVFPQRLGLKDEVARTLPIYAVLTQPTPNGMQHSWGQANAGLLAEGIQSALLQSCDGVILVAPAWPAEWNAEFQLLARGGFLVSSSIRGGRPRVIRIEATFGRTCRVGNPWGDCSVDLYSDGRGPIRLTGHLLEFALSRGSRVLLVPTGTDVATLKDAVGPDFPPAARKLPVILPDGKKGTAYLGKF